MGFTDFAPDVFHCFNFSEILLNFRNFGSAFLSLFTEEVVLLLLFSLDVTNERHHRQCSVPGLQVKNEHLAGRVRSFSNLQ